jgi:hypothetical protein
MMNNNNQLINIKRNESFNIGQYLHPSILKALGDTVKPANNTDPGDQRQKQCYLDGGFGYFFTPTDTEAY